MEGEAKLGISTPEREARAAPGARGDARVVLRAAPDGAAAEQFRMLGARLEGIALSGKPRLGVTSPDGREGRTTTAANVALAIGRRQRVLLVEADFRRPSLHHAFGLSPVLGLVDVIAGRASLERATVSLGEATIDLLPAGVTTTPHAVVAAPRMRQILVEAAARYDVIIVDLPSLLGTADVLTLVGSLDGVVLVARAGRTTRDRYRLAASALPDGKIVGAVLVGV